MFIPVYLFQVGVDIFSWVDIALPLGWVTWRLEVVKALKALQVVIVGLLLKPEMDQPWNVSGPLLWWRWANGLN